MNENGYESRLTTLPDAQSHPSSYSPSTSRGLFLLVLPQEHGPPVLVIAGTLAWRLRSRRAWLLRREAKLWAKKRTASACVVSTEYRRIQTMMGHFWERAFEMIRASGASIEIPAQ